jgi:enamine deaminase RidA (YjgF/YER057c/UK114 family)
MANAEHFHPDGLQDSRARFSHAVKAGTTVYIAGQTGVDGLGNLVGKDDFEAQAYQVLLNLQTAVRAAGGELADIVTWKIYVTDRAYGARLAPVRREFLTENLPAATLLVVAGLASPDYLIEIDAVAVL